MTLTAANFKKKVLFQAFLVFCISSLYVFFIKPKWTSFDLKTIKIKLNTAGFTIYNSKLEEGYLFLQFNKSERTPKTMTLSLTPLNNLERFLANPQLVKKNLGKSKQLLYVSNYGGGGSGGIEGDTQGSLIVDRTPIYFTCHYQSEGSFKPTWCLPLIRSLKLLSSQP